MKHRPNYQLQLIRQKWGQALNATVPQRRGMIDCCRLYAEAAKDWDPLVELVLRQAVVARRTRAAT